MQEAAPVPGRRPAQHHQQFAGVDLRRPKGYAAPAPAAAQAAATSEGDPCPRCESRDTKFCYYNNYNTSQPRHFCRGCRRYWTKGGTLRNVPVGGGTRKKPSSSSYAANSDKQSKKPSKKKRRVVAPAPEPAAAAEADADAAPASDPAKTTATNETTTTATTTATAGTPTTTDAASEITTDLVVPAAAAAAAAAEEEDSLSHLLQPDVALGLGISDFPSGKGLDRLDVEPDSFEWPASFDLGTCWGSAGFADPDPAGLFLNFP